ncbi:alpha/beta fold hydrolase [Actinomycetospora flava]|uniref:Alpha/beta fold hydrolase n=1 Tax=Actinomycetospora flava TaxID=3129232 RepID=A0ABU8LYD2_9PSEU
MTAAPSPVIDTLAVPGARLHHEVRGTGPLVVLLGTPMGADAFAGLADLLAADHTVLTTDVRGIGRSPVDDPEASPTLSTRAHDVARLIRQSDPAGPVTLFGSSGGAVTALAVAQEHPGLVDTVVAHEPPLVELLPDREERHAGEDVVIERWFAGDHVGSWRAFLENADIAMPEEVFRMVFASAPDAAAKADGDYQNAHLLRPTTHFRPMSRCCAPGARASSSASARTRPDSCATAPRGRWRPRWASTRRSSPATTSASPTTRPPSCRHCARCSPGRWPDG